MDRLRVKRRWKAPEACGILKTKEEKEEEGDFDDSRDNLVGGDIASDTDDGYGSSGGKGDRSGDYEEEDGEQEG